MNQGIDVSDSKAVLQCREGMNYDRVYTKDFVNGVGIRVTMFVTGCAHACKGCHNRSALNRKSGKPFTEEVMEKVLDLCADHDGLTLTGGDPLLPHSRPTILALCKAFKSRYPDKDIWMWTGYKFNEVEGLEILKYVDVLIDGRFEQDNPTVKPWRGSANQNLLVLKEGKVVDVQ